MELDTIGDRSSSPAERSVLVVCNGGVRAGGQSRRKRARDPSLERIAGEFLHLVLDRLQALSFALSDLDREELKHMPIVVRCCRSRSLGAIEESAGNVESYGTRARSCTSRRIGRPHAGRVYESRDVSGEATGVPGSVLGVGAEESDWRFSHVDRITLKSSGRSS